MSNYTITGHEVQVQVALQGQTRWFGVRYFGGFSHDTQGAWTPKIVCLHGDTVVPVRRILNGK